MSTAAELENRLEIFFGEASQALCRVYARLDNTAVDPSSTLTGTLAGPTCRYAETLPAVFSFADRGPGRSLLAEAVLPEPCFWTPALPHLYQADLQVRRADKVLARVQRTVGIRPLGASGHKLIYAGRSWVLRGVAADELPPVDPAAWHDAETAMCVHAADDGLCESASRLGVLLVADLDAPHLPEIRRLARWPAVGVICLPGPDAPDGLAQLRHNAILAQRFAPGEPVHPAPWAHAVLVEMNSAQQLPGLGDCRLPVIALRPAGTLPSIAAGRAACDALQRDLAPCGQFAGYIV